MIPLIGMGRYPGNNEFLNRYKKVRNNPVPPKLPIGYDKTKLIEIDNGINRKIPAIQNVFRFWIVNDEKEYLTTGFSKLDLGKNHATRSTYIKRKYQFLKKTDTVSRYNANQLSRTDPNPGTTNLHTQLHFGQ